MCPTIVDNSDAFVAQQSLLTASHKYSKMPVAKEHIPSPEKSCGFFYWSAIRDTNDAWSGREFGGTFRQLDCRVAVMILEGEFKFQELIEYARKWVANPGTPTISAACKMIKRSHMAAALVFDFATKFDMQEHTRFVVDVTKAGMAEDAMVDVGMMSNYDLRLSMDLLKML